MCKYDRALADYSQAINIKSSHTAAYYFRGLAYRDKNDRAKATFDFLKVLELTKDPFLRKKTSLQLQELGVN
jgi:tetratricopeptide (TPR) repeat protein